MPALEQTATEVKLPKSNTLSGNTENETNNADKTPPKIDLRLEESDEDDATSKHSDSTLVLKMDSEDEILNKYDNSDTWEQNGFIDAKNEDDLLDDNPCDSPRSDEETDRTEKAELKTKKSGSTNKHNSSTESKKSDVQNTKTTNKNGTSTKVGTSTEHTDSAKAQSKDQDCNEARNSPSIESDDLLDVSIIKDANQDAVDAYNEARPIHKDDDDCNEDEENLTKSDSERDKIDKMEISDGKDSDSDSNGATKDSDRIDVNNEVLKQSNVNEIEIEENVPNGENENLQTENQKKSDSAMDDSLRGGDSMVRKKRKERKRTPSDETSHETIKKIRTENQTETSTQKITIPVDNDAIIVEQSKDSETKKSQSSPVQQSLLSLTKFLRNRHLKELTRNDLEEFCLQKMCEAIVHKSELGDIHQQLKVQEHLIETMRKELQQVTKQARDLDIVNKKLMNDLKTHNTTNKPLTPLKITRSVGLQVKLIGCDSQLRRRLSANTMPSNTAPTISAPSRVRNTPTANNQNRQQSTPKPIQAKQVPTPILSLALQNRRVSTNENNKSPNIASPLTASKSAKTPDKNTSFFIDLTDDDDKKTVNSKTNNSGNNRSITRNTQNSVKTNGLRTVGTIPLKITGNMKASAGVPNSTQLMYVVQSNSPQNAGQKAVLLNLQPTNGVLPSAFNGAISVIPKTNTSIQLKPTSKPAESHHKHPAPLPHAPATRVNTSKALKPTPPKPHLTIRKTETGIILQWRMPYDLDQYESIVSYQLFAYQETTAAPTSDMWRKVGDVKALALPMACTLTQFADKNKYYFAVRPVDTHKRLGAFSDPEEISL